ncbi:RNA polymerase recycling motor HelD [Lacticaseibacillus zhaodongensis]|uniref:RNA polymerase recycling motor HelD n=1 Tax=Lacticaseibacillus zhaodongensis TaxID=2668065 RepID=UPI0012D336C7|nr:RNA polymerase recycling motor HelD [Lacticaseibacillus zhaodongensis]
MDQTQEQKRVDRVRTYIKGRLVTVADQIATAHAETQQVERNYGDNTKVNTTEVDDAMETNAAVQQQKMLVTSAAENERILKHEQSTLKRLDPAPYFGRIDVQEAGSKTSEPLYIGTGSLQDENGHFLVYDWRAPIASIYYNGTLGRVSYDTVSGKQTVDLTRKRQFRIEDGQIVHMFDTSETVGDEMLQAVLGEQSDEYMRSIVSTIQREQNAIIRDTSSQLLIVQGAAGSGKTSAILQRIAFLLYHSRNTLESDQMVLFSPNRIFASYISAVLPSLGEKNMIQTTLSEFLTQRFTGLQVETLFDRFEADETNLPDSTAAMRRFKESAEFMDLAEHFAKTQHELCFQDIELDGSTFFSKETMAHIYAEQPAAATPADKFAAVRKTLMKRLNLRISIEAHQDWVDEVLAGLSEADVRHYIGTETFEDSGDELRAVARAVVAEKFSPVYTALYDDYFIDPYAEYLQFLNSTEQDLVSRGAWQEMARAFARGLEEHKLRLEDAAPIMLIRDILTGSGQNHSIMAVFVDEMQDYSPALLRYIHHAFPRATLTFLGDEAQDVFSSRYTKSGYIDSLQRAFPDLRQRVITLNRAYRSSAPITKFASSLLPGGSKIQAFARDGAQPRLLIAPREELQQTLLQALRPLAAAYHTVALITKTSAQAAALTAQLHLAAPELNASELKADDQKLGHGVLVLPVYLAKGLEFDAVIAYDVSAANYGAASDRDILYTVATRALHELLLIARDTPAPMLSAPETQQFLDVQRSGVREASHD